MSKEVQSSVKAIQLFGSWLEDVFVGTLLVFGICFIAVSVEILARKIFEWTQKRLLFNYSVW